MDHLQSGTITLWSTTSSLSRKERLKVASLLLSYPGDDFPQLLDEIGALSKEAGDELAEATVEAMRRQSMPELIRSYVATFDMRESTALYLTAHELGDSRERGGALLHMHALLRSAHLEPLHGELPDYLPLLLEFLAEKPQGMPTHDLEARIAVVCSAIHERLEVDHPYRKVFELIQTGLSHVLHDGHHPGQPPSNSAQEPDLDNLPYPLVYD